MSSHEEDDLRDAIEENAASLLEIDDSLLSSPADEELLEVCSDLLGSEDHRLKSTCHSSVLLRGSQSCYRRGGIFRPPEQSLQLLY